MRLSYHALPASPPSHPHTHIIHSLTHPDTATPPISMAYSKHHEESGTYLEVRCYFPRGVVDDHDDENCGRRRGGHVRPGCRCAFVKLVHCARFHLCRAYRHVPLTRPTPSAGHSSVPPSLRPSLFLIPQDFLERLQPLPNDIQRSFHLMRELDKDATELHMYVL